VLHQARDVDAGIGQKPRRDGTTAGAMGEHLAGSAVRIESDGHHETRAAMLEHDRFSKAPIGKTRGPVAGLVGIEGGVVSGVINLESLGVRAPSRRPRHENRYHDA
jgi:hypothetical protein